MLNALLNTTNVPLLEQLASFTERRQEVLAGNVSNIDTPDYKRRDLPVSDFEAALAQAIEDRRDPVVSRYGRSEADVSKYFSRGLHVAQTADPSNAIFQDGAERSIEADALAMTKNLMMQNLAVELMTNHMNLLGSVIRGQV